MKIETIESLEKIYDHNPEYFHDISLKDFIHAIDSQNHERTAESKHHLRVKGLNLLKNYLDQFTSFDKDSMIIYQEIEKIITLIQEKIEINTNHSNNQEFPETQVSSFQQEIDQTPENLVKINYSDLDDSLDEALESLGDEIYQSIDQLKTQIEIMDPIQFNEENLLNSDSTTRAENTLYKKERNALTETKNEEITLDSGGNCIQEFEKDPTLLDIEILKDPHNLQVLESIFYISMGFDKRKSLFYSYVFTKIFYKLQLFNFPTTLKLNFDDFKIKTINTEMNSQEQMVQILLYKLFKKEIPEELHKEAEFVDSMIYLRNLNLIEFIKSFNSFFYQVMEITIEDDCIKIERAKRAKNLEFFNLDFIEITEIKELYDFLNNTKKIQEHSYKIMILNLLRDGFVQEDISRLNYLMNNLRLRNVECIKPKIIPERKLLTIDTSNLKNLLN